MGDPALQERLHWAISAVKGDLTWWYSGHQTDWTRDHRERVVYSKRELARADLIELRASNAARVLRGNDKPTQQYRELRLVRVTRRWRERSTESPPEGKP